jgi:aspartate aminotransferase
MGVKMRATDRGCNLPVSELHEIHRLVENLENRESRTILRLHVGEPAFRPPESVQAAITNAMHDGRTDYTSAEGLALLRERLAENVNRRKLIAARSEQIVVTPGSTQGIFAVMLAMCDPGDEILIPETHWPIYNHAASIAGLRIRYYPLTPGYDLDPDRIIAASTTYTRMLVINSPGNPAGGVCDEQTLKDIVNVAHNNGWWIISDEAYEHFAFDRKHCSAAPLERDVPEAERRVFSLHSFSKSYGMTGYRIGYVIAPCYAAAMALCRVQEGTIVAPSTPIQYGALAALKEDAFVEAAHAHLVRNLNCLTDPAREGFLTVMPQGGWYALLDISRSGLSSGQFASRLLSEFDVAVAPGSAFVPARANDPSTVRVAFCGDCAVVAEGIARIGTLIRGRNMYN